jgi:hypothetical protein
MITERNSEYGQTVADCISAYVKQHVRHACSQAYRRMTSLTKRDQISDTRRLYEFVLVVRDLIWPAVSNVLHLATRPGSALSITDAAAAAADAAAVRR